MRGLPKAALAGDRPAKLGSEHKFSRPLADPAGAAQKIVIRPQIRLSLSVVSMLS